MILRIATFGLIIIATIVSVVIYFQKRKATVPQAIIHTNTSRTPRFGEQGNQTFQASRPANDEGRRNLVEDLTSGMNQQAKFLIDQSLQSVVLVELEKRRFTNISAVSLLSGLQRKLFIEDYNYAVAATKSGDCGHGASLQSKVLVPALARLTLADLEAGISQ